ncbi:putative ribonuclease H-like domain-containing protein [Tanacetum coccineum]
MIDYALWEVIKNGNSTPKTIVVEGVEKVIPLTTVKEKAQKRLEVKAKITLMMGIPNEHQLNFNSIKDAKSLLEAIKKRFGGNAAIKKTQRNLLKQQYENFFAPSSESLDQTFNMLQKLLLRSLSLEWNTHAVVWRNKPELETISMDDLYNNLKVYEPEVKGTSSSSTSTQNTAFVSSNNFGSTNEAVNTAHRVSAASTQVSVVANSINVDNLNDVVICAFFSSQPNNPQLINEDLQQFHPDDLKKIDLRWQMAMLTIRARRFLKNTRRKVTINGNETISLEEFVNEPIVNEPTVKKSVVETSEAKASADKPKVVRKNNRAPIIEDWVSDNEEEDIPQAKKEKKTKHGSKSSINEVWHRSLTTARPVNTAQPRTTVNSARPMTNVFNKAHSTVRRPINNKTTTKNINFNKRVNIVSGMNVNTARPKAVLNAVKGNQVNVVKASACWVWKPKTKVINHISKHNSASTIQKKGNPQMDLQDQGLIDSGCSRHMTGNLSYLTDFEEINGGYVAFGGNPKGGKITGRGAIKTGNLDFENVYFVRELQFNLFSVSQMSDKKNSVLFNDTECIVLSLNFKLTDESHVLLKVPRKNNMYSVDSKNIVPKGGLTCIFVKVTFDESKLWHRRLGHINFKTMNKLVNGNLVRGLPSKRFENDQTCVACQKGKQHRAFCKSKTVSSINQPLHMLHMDLFGPTFVKNLMKKMYCLVVTNDYSRFSWVFFLAANDETSRILKSFITGVENLIDQRVKVIRCDNGTEFKYKEMNQFCKRKE